MSERDFWTMGELPESVPEPPPGPGQLDPAVDHLAEAPVSVRGRALVDVLRPAYEAFADL